MYVYIDDVYIDDVYIDDVYIDDVCCWLLLWTQGGGVVTALRADMPQFLSIVYNGGFFAGAAPTNGFAKMHEKMDESEKSANIVFQNEVIFVQLGELDELDRITMHESDWIAVSHKHRKQFGVMVKVLDC